MSSPDAITRLFRACDPGEPVSPGDPRWVNCDDVRGENLALLYERSLRLADPSRPEVKVFAGHRGVGKTSELLRLRGMLEDQKRGRPFQVIFADVSGTLDLNDLDFPDLLVFLAGEVQDQLRKVELPGFSTRSEALRIAWDAIKDVIPGGIELKGADVELPFGKLALEFKNRPSARSELREAIEKQSTSLLAAVNDLLQYATVQLRAKDYEGLVLLVDGLDKLIRRDLSGGGNTHDRLFIDRSEQLASLQAHVIYTVPISLIYSPQFTQLEQTFGEHQVPVPMIRLRGDGRSEPTPGTPGMKKMQEMIEARCKQAQVEFAEVFDSLETCHYLCRMTGGHPRHLMMFLQSASIQVEAFPVTRKAAEKAVRNYANSLLREIPDEFWPALRVFDTPQGSIDHDDLHQQMLLLLHVFEYMNGDPWWEVNPVLRILPKFRDSR